MRNYQCPGISSGSGNSDQDVQRDYFIRRLSYYMTVVLFYAESYNLEIRDDNQLTEVSGSPRLEY